MMGIIVGGLIGFIVTIGVIFVLSGIGVLENVGLGWSFLIGFGLGSLFVNLGVMLGGLYNY